MRCQTIVAIYINLVSVALTSAQISTDGSTVASLSLRLCHEGSPVTVTCAFSGSPPFGTSASDLELVKFVSHSPFTAADESELVDFASSPSSQPMAVIDTANWLLRAPWSAYTLRYQQAVARNETSVSFHINSAIAEDSGYYGCRLKSGSYSVFKPLLVYAKDIPVNVTVLIGASSSVPEIAGELAVRYDSMKSSFVEVAVRLESAYASLPFAARLFSGRNVSQYLVVSPHTEVTCRVPGLCLCAVKVMVQLVLSEVRRLHLDQLVLSVSHPRLGNSSQLWGARARLVDESQSLSAAKVTNRSVTCRVLPSGRARVRHGTPFGVACSVPRVWVSLPGYMAYWSVESPVQFYPVGRVACAYPPVAPRPALADFTAGSARMLEPPTAAGTPAAGNLCRGNPFLTLLDADFSSREIALGEGLDGQVEYLYRVPVAYYVHGGRRATFRVAVTPAANESASAYLETPAPEHSFSFVIEGQPKSGSRSWAPLSPLLALTLTALPLLPRLPW